MQLLVGRGLAAERPLVGGHVRVDLLALDAGPAHVLVPQVTHEESHVREEGLLQRDPRVALGIEDGQDRMRHEVVRVRLRAGAPLGVPQEGGADPPLCELRQRTSRRGSVGVEHVDGRTYHRRRRVVSRPTTGRGKSESGARVDGRPGNMALTAVRRSSDEAPSVLRGAAVGAATSRPWSREVRPSPG